ncbi:MAG TPA: butyrate kinase [Bacteroidales bacterium]|nr:butyrate kinase [Bacteroidales bacterium]
MGKRLILAINPGSTSTKISLFEEDKLVFENTLRHSVEDLSVFQKVTDQFNFRKDLILEEIRSRKIDTDRIVAIVGRGGLLKPIESGVYRVNERMKDDLASARYGQHASNLGALIAEELSNEFKNSTAYIADPVVVDELQDVARISGHPAIERKSIFHALNQKAVARTYCTLKGKKYEEVNLIIAHMGGGISIGTHRKGRVVDVNNAFDGEGPLSPERSGSLPAGQLAALCFSGNYSHQEVKEMITGKGGMVAYIGTNSFVEAGKMAEKGDEKASLIRKAIAYQVSKEIGAAAAILYGKVDAIILTGGLAYDREHVDLIKAMVGFIADVEIYPGEDEMKSLASKGLLVLEGKVDVRDYH